MSNTPYRVLAIEGGGMRGYYTATLLNALCRLFNDGSPKADWGKNLDLICGTSTGAILACAIAKGVPLQEVMGMYKEEGKRIFFRPMPKNIIKRMYWLMQHLGHHSTEAVHLKNALENYFGDMTLEGIYKERGIALCIPAVNASDYRAWVFKTPHDKTFNRDKKYRLVDVCMASAAAPLLFSPHRVKNPNNPDNIQHFVDGGMWANSPVLVSLIEALKIVQSERDIHILSVGTVDTPNGDPNALRKSQWGIRQWKLGIESMEMSISAQSYGYYNMALFVANSFSKNGREIKVMRLVEKPKSPGDYSAIGIDRADELAIRTMSEMAETDASENYSRVFTKGENPEIRDFFTPQTTSEEIDNDETKRHQ